MLKQLQHTIDSTYLSVERIRLKAQQLKVERTEPDHKQRHQSRRALDRRCGRDRRQQDRAILLDLRSPYARRRAGRRNEEKSAGKTAIDVFA